MTWGSGTRCAEEKCFALLVHQHDGGESNTPPCVQYSSPPSAVSDEFAHPPRGLALLMLLGERVQSESEPIHLPLELWPAPLGSRVGGFAPRAVTRAHPLYTPGNACVSYGVTAYCCSTAVPECRLSARSKAPAKLPRYDATGYDAPHKKEAVMINLTDEQHGGQPLFGELPPCRDERAWLWHCSREVCNSMLLRYTIACY
jgi:hypothetical protein